MMSHSRQKATNATDTDNETECNNSSSEYRLLTVDQDQNDVPATKIPTSPTLFQRVYSAVFYAVSSFALVFINKIVLTHYKFPSYLVVGIGQMVAVVLVLFVLSYLRFTDLPTPNVSTVKKVFPLPLLFMANLVSGLGSTKQLSMPMFTVLRRFSIVMTMVAEYFILKYTPRSSIVVAVTFMIVGSLVAVADDLAFEMYGYTLILINDFATAAIGVCLKMKLDAKELGKNGLLFCNALLMLPFAIIIGYFSNDLEIAFKYEQWTDLRFVILFLVSCFCGFILNYSMVLCTHYNTALTTCCVGTMKNLLVTYLGMIFSGDYIFSWWNFIGINISVVGSFIYTYVTFALGQPAQA